MKARGIWITWEDHRRSRELAVAFNAEYVPLLNSRRRYIRYPVLTFKTLIFLLRTKPELIFCQNPSIILTTFLCLMKPVLGFKLVVDRHSNFKFYTISSKNLKWRLFHLLSAFTLEKADLTIVTNNFLKSYINSKGGRADVLQDKLPTFNNLGKVPLKGKVNFVFISTFSNDEPVREVIEAARSLTIDHHLYVTGGYRKYSKIKEIQESLPANVTLTGFIPESDYQALIHSADILIVITDQEYTLTCGAYEAVSLGKPMILGNTQTIKDYFSKGAVYTAPYRDDIAASMKKTVEHLAVAKSEVAQLKLELQLSWETSFVKVGAQISKL